MVLDWPRNSPDLNPIENLWIILKDNVAEVKDYLQRENIIVLDWPSNSPDLNPIKNLWIILKDNVAEVKDYQQRENNGS